MIEDSLTNAVDQFNALNVPPLFEPLLFLPVIVIVLSVLYGALMVVVEEMSLPHHRHSAAVSSPVTKTEFAYQMETRLERLCQQAMSEESPLRLRYQMSRIEKELLSLLSVCKQKDLSIEDRYAVESVIDDHLPSIWTPYLLLHSSKQGNFSAPTEEVLRQLKIILSSIKDIRAKIDREHLLDLQISAAFLEDKYAHGEKQYYSSTSDEHSRSIVSL